MFNLHGDIYNVQEEIIYFQKALYDYFKVQYGTIKSVDRNTEYQEKHSNLSKRQLRKTSTTLYIHRFLYLYIHQKYIHHFLIYHFEIEFRKPIYWVFFLENQFTESNIQKRFWRAILGTMEYTEQLTHHQTLKK